MGTIENAVVGRIANAELVRQHFGYWPGFHDAEIIKVTFEANKGFWPSVTFTLAVAETTKQTDARGCFQQIKHCLIELQFTGLREIEFEDFSHQNVIFDLALEESEGNLKCTIDSSVGLQAFVLAEAAAVRSLTPINA